jgi:hypothetical protein
MSTIIAAQYDTFDEAAQATNRLRAAGFDEDAIATFFNNAPGRHATFPIGGDEFADPEAHVLNEGAAKGAAVGAGVGLAAAAGGPLAAGAAAGVGAYVGGLAGAAAESEASDDADPQKIWRRPAGVMVAVAAPNRSREEAAVHAFRDTGGRHIERAVGTIRDGNWVDFDPVAAPRLIDETQRSAAPS